MRIALISHCDLTGNSAMHVFSMAECFSHLNHDVVMIIPSGIESASAHRESCFPIVTYAQAVASPLPFKSEGTADIVHSWTAREHVRIITEDIILREECPLIIHMEDNEEKILTDEIYNLDFNELKNLPSFYQEKIIAQNRSHPIKYKATISRANGYTCLIRNLLEFKPDNIPGHVFWPGFDPEFRDLPPRSEQLREQLNISPDETVILYSGNVHHSIKDDISNLYLVVALLRSQGRKLILLRTGWNYAQLNIDKALLDTNAFIELGFVDRDQIPNLLSIADILVQPGKSDSFNDYRFPSKIPEYLVSGKPVILPNSNIGCELEDRVDVLKIYDGTFIELRQKIEELLDNKDLCRELGRAGRKFALKNLTWDRAASEVIDFYRKVIDAYHTNEPLALEDNSKLTEATDTQLPVKAIAFYLPQFHPIAENDLWWGKGFTEWTNVSRARPQFPMHKHPRLPTDLGYYDLRIPEVMHAQAALAQEYGIGGFCFYYYWFDKRRLLERPIDNYLTQGPDFPFCVCWANENWSRRWDGSENSILMEQKYIDGFEHELISDLAPILNDSRYITVDGAPLLLLYRISDFPNPVQNILNIRHAAKSLGFEKIHITAVQSFGLEDPRLFGVDAAVEFSPPHTNRALLSPIQVGVNNTDFTGYLEDYISVAASSINAPPTDFIRYRGCFPMWDNTARKRNAGHIFINESTKAYAYWLRFLTHEALLRRNQNEPFIFINAWNEWAEGAYLEPDEHYGYAFLEATREAIAQGIADFALGPCSPDVEREFVKYVSRIGSQAQS